MLCIASVQEEQLLAEDVYENACIDDALVSDLTTLTAHILASPYSPLIDTVPSTRPTPPSLTRHASRVRCMCRA